MVIVLSRNVSTVSTRFKTFLIFNNANKQCRCKKWIYFFNKFNFMRESIRSEYEVSGSKRTTNYGFRYMKYLYN